jgi:hypothetical protein
MAVVNIRYFSTRKAIASTAQASRSLSCKEITADLIGRPFGFSTKGQNMSYDSIFAFKEFETFVGFHVAIGGIVPVGLSRKDRVHGAGHE